MPKRKTASAENERPSEVVKSGAAENLKDRGDDKSKESVAPSKAGEQAANKKRVVEDEKHALELEKQRLELEKQRIEVEKEKAQVKLAKRESESAKSISQIGESDQSRIRHNVSEQSRQRQISSAATPYQPRSSANNRSSEERSGGVGAGLGWMLFLQVILFWLPVLGGFIAGIVGGKKSGSIGAAIVAALIPAIALGVAFAIVGVALGSFLEGLPLLSDIPGLGALIGLISGGGALISALLASGPLLVGAILGGLFTGGDG